MDENSRWHFDYDDDCLEENKHGDDHDFLEKTIKKSLRDVMLGKSQEVVSVHPSWSSDLFNYLRICTGTCHLSRFNTWTSRFWLACGCPDKPPDPPGMEWNGNIDTLVVERASRRARQNPKVLKPYFEILKKFWETFKDDESFQKFHKEFPYGYVDSRVRKLFIKYWQTWENLVRKMFIEYAGWKEDYSIGR